MRRSRRSWFTAVHLEFPDTRVPRPLIFSVPRVIAAFVFLPLLVVFTLGAGALHPLCSRSTGVVPGVVRSCAALSFAVLIVSLPCPALTSSVVTSARGAFPPRSVLGNGPFVGFVPGCVVLCSVLFAVAVHILATTIRKARKLLLSFSGDLQGRALCAVCLSLSAG